MANHLFEKSRATIRAIMIMLEKLASAITPSIASNHKTSSTKAISLNGLGKISNAQSIRPKISTSTKETLWLFIEKRIGFGIFIPGISMYPSTQSKTSKTTITSDMYLLYQQPSPYFKSPVNFFL